MDPLIDLTDYQQRELPLHIQRLGYVQLAICHITVAGGFLLVWAWATARPIHVGLGVFLVLASFLAMYIFDRNQKQNPIRCPDCDGEMKPHRSDADLQYGWLHSMVKFRAHGCSYQKTQDEGLGKTLWYRLMRGVLTCQKCRTFIEVARVIPEPTTDHDLWIIHEYEHGDPIPMDLEPGQTLTQFELSESAREKEATEHLVL